MNWQDLTKVFTTFKTFFYHIQNFFYNIQNFLPHSKQALFTLAKLIVEDYFLREGELESGRWAINGGSAKRALFIYCCGAAAPQQQLKAGQRGEEIHPSNNTPRHHTTITHTTIITITITRTRTPFLRRWQGGDCFDAIWNLLIWLVRENSS